MKLGVRGPLRRRLCKRSLGYSWRHCAGDQERTARGELITRTRSAWSGTSLNLLDLVDRVLARLALLRSRENFEEPFTGLRGHGFGGASKTRTGLTFPQSIFAFPRLPPEEPVQPDNILSAVIISLLRSCYDASACCVTTRVPRGVHSDLAGAPYSAAQTPDASVNPSPDAMCDIKRLHRGFVVSARHSEELEESGQHARGSRRRLSPSVIGRTRARLVPKPVSQPASPAVRLRQTARAVSAAVRHSAGRSGSGF